MIEASVVFESIFFTGNRSGAFVTDRNTTCLITLDRHDLTETVLNVWCMFFAFIGADNMFGTCQTLKTSVEHVDEIVTIRNNRIAFAATK
jgi:hypothetical protein